MAESSLVTWEEKKNVVTGELHLALEAATAPRARSRRIPLLANIRQLLRIDLSAIDLSAGEPLPMFLKAVLGYHREIAAQLDRLLQVQDPLQRKRIRKLVGTREEITSVLEALEDKIEDLEIAISPEVHAAIEQLIDEAKAP
jgi:hypothetical protein